MKLCQRQLISAYKYALLFIACLTATCSGQGLLGQCKSRAVLRKSSGVITSPSVPLVVTQSYCVSWLIAARPGDTLTFRFESFSVGSTRQSGDGRVYCLDNYVYFGERLLCGTQPPSTLGPLKVNHDGTLEVKMTIAAQTQNQGPLYSSTSPNSFTIYYTTQQANQPPTTTPSFESECGGRKEGSYGTVHSPFYPQRYPTNKQCVWTLYVPQPPIQLRLMHFDLGGISYQPDLSADYLLIIDGDQMGDREIGRFFGNQLESVPPKVIEGTGNRLTLVLRSSSSAIYRGHGFNATFQQKGVCMPDQNACGHGEDDCYSATGRCDYLWECPLHGGDEMGCPGCGEGMYRCRGAQGGGTHQQCYAPDERCDGLDKCNDRSDELACSSALCGPHNGTFLCASGHCIFETWRCDGQFDCLDHSDEVDCHSTPSRKVITAAVLGTLVCAMLMVVALGCTCKLYALRFRHLYYPRLDTPMGRIAAYFAGRVPPPPYNEALTSSRPYDEWVAELQRQRTGAEAERGEGRGRQEGDDDEALIQLAPDERERVPAMIELHVEGQDETREDDDDELLGAADGLPVPSASSHQQTDTLSCLGMSVGENHEMSEISSRSEVSMAGSSSGGADGPDDDGGSLASEDDVMDEAAGQEEEEMEEECEDDDEPLIP